MTTHAEGSGAEKFINFCLVWCDVASKGQEIPKGNYGVYNSPKTLISALASKKLLNQKSKDT